MGFYTSKETADPPEVKTPAGNAGREIVLHRSPSAAALREIAKETLSSCGFSPDFQAPKIGDKMPDDSIYAGVSPDTGEAMYVTPATAPLAMTFNEAADYAAKLDAHGHKDWRVPTKDELNVLFNNRTAIGGFNVTGSDPIGWHWSASHGDGCLAWCQFFSDGFHYNFNKTDHMFVRCVR